MTFGRHWIAVAAVVPLLLLGACSQDDPQPTFSPPSDSPSVTESSPTEPVVRPWEKKTEAGAVAFAKHWADVFSQAMRSNETDELRGNSAPTCDACDAVATRLESIASDGGFYMCPDGWRIVRAVPTKSAGSGKVFVAIRVVQGAERFKETAGDQVVVNDESRASYSAELSWATDRWLMQELTLLS